MLELRLGFHQGQITGHGYDIVGPFVFSGAISEGGQVGMVKQYIDRHAVLYIGAHDGEGSMWGEWRIGPIRGRWAIKMRVASMDRDAAAWDWPPAS